MQIVCNEQFEKHESSIRVSRDPFLHVIDSSFDEVKQDFGRILTFRGMMIVFNGYFHEIQNGSISREMQGCLTDGITHAEDMTKFASQSRNLGREGRE
jgi:hypothetical protein